MEENYRLIEEAKERAVDRANGSIEFEAYDRVGKVE